MKAIELVKKIYPNQTRKHIRAFCPKYFGINIELCVEVNEKAKCTDCWNKEVDEKIANELLSAHEMCKLMCD